VGYRWSGGYAESFCFLAFGFCWTAPLCPLSMDGRGGCNSWQQGNSGCWDERQEGGGVGFVYFRSASVLHRFVTSGVAPFRLRCIKHGASGAKKVIDRRRVKPSNGVDASRHRVTRNRRMFIICRYLSYGFGLKERYFRHVVVVVYYEGPQDFCSSAENRRNPSRS
jgi:hypothetical protein